MMPTHLLRAGLLAASLAALAGCGGGSEGGSGPAAPPPAAAPPPDAGAPAAVRVGAGPGCTLEYALTASPLLAGADPLLAQQWHLQNAGQGGGTVGEDLRAFPAWAVTRGEGVRVAVIDDAIEVLHRALRPNVVEGASYSYRPGNRGTPYPLPCAPDDGHGTAVAGLVAARDGDADGGAGVAPRAALVAYDALASGTDADIADALVRGLDAVGVYHNSWGSPDDGSLHPTGAAFGAAIDAGLAGGRGGRGAVYVFSAGNGGCYARRNVAGRPCLVDDSNYDGYVNRRGVIAVCAVDDAGRRPPYGEPGANLAVCAPSSGARPGGVTTTGLRDTWVSDFTGTSASAPMVSGVVALMLSANPALSWRDVRLILARTARLNDAADPDWLPAGDPADARANRGFVNGGVFNHKYGFGVVDAETAVATARGWTSVGGSQQLVACGPFRREQLARPLPDAPASGAPTPVTDDLVVPATGLGACPITRIEWVELRLTAPHAYPGDLRVRLTSPAGRTSRLAEGRACAGGCGEYADWSFGSMRHLEEPAAGAWRLEVTDVQNQDVGTLQDWSLVIHGR